MTHTLQQDFEHFLSYSGLSSESEDVKAKLLKAYEANWLECRHWKANHADMVKRAALLSQRLDLPVDRIPAYAELERLQAAINAKQTEYSAVVAQPSEGRLCNLQEIWDLALQYAGERQVNDAGELVFETAQDFADCIQDVLYSIQHPDTVRLDWLQSKMHRSSIRLADMTFKTVNAWAITADGTDLRATIDAVKAFEENQNER